MMRRAGIAMLALLMGAAPVLAHDDGAREQDSERIAPSHEHRDGIRPTAAPSVLAPFDIVHAKIRTEGNVAVFHMAVSGRAGATRPTATGSFEGSTVFSYVWPTTIDPWEVGFDHDSGILALAVTSHPDFDDTPLFESAMKSVATTLVREAKFDTTDFATAKGRGCEGFTLLVSRTRADSRDGWFGAFQRGDERLDVVGHLE